MSINKSFYITVTLIVCVLSPSLTIAYDFNLTIPVTARKIHTDVGSLRVICDVCAGSCVGDNIIGTEISEVISRNQFLNGESYTGTFTLSFNAEPGKNMADATIYNCELFVAPINSSNQFLRIVETGTQEWRKCNNFCNYSNSGQLSTY